MSLSFQDNICADLAGNAAAMMYGVRPVVERGIKRGDPHSVLARQTAIYLCHTVFHMPITKAGRAFGRHSATARHACDVVEQCREDPVFDRMLARMEDFLRTAPLQA